MDLELEPRSTTTRSWPKRTTSWSASKSPSSGGSRNALNSFEHKPSRLANLVRRARRNPKRKGGLFSISCKNSAKKNCCESATAPTISDRQLIRCAASRSECVMRAALSGLRTTCVPDFNRLRTLCLNPRPIESLSHSPLSYAVPTSPVPSSTQVRAFIRRYGISSTFPVVLRASRSR